MSDLAAAWQNTNISRAWRWIRSNPDRMFKNYFRDLYAVYAVADEKLLRHLADRLRRGIYEPRDACKIFFPKPSGISRPYSLLCIEDQIVYQAMTNIVAERFVPSIRHRYNTEIFGHLYSGPSSTWFYRKWSDGYRAFNRETEKAFREGYVWRATFDLTAFYDSIDHSVLRHVLATVGIDQQFARTLTDHLAKWTATSTRIYHNHGIPQGPLSSGLIAETVLSHFDQSHTRRYDVKYFRYVDDIRLFAKREEHLRHALLTLDRLSKDVGLFPQSSKINIHKVADIAKELKSVSNPVEAVFETPAVDQVALRARIVSLSRRFKIEDPTRFKYLVARAAPSTVVADRLWRIYEQAPEYYVQLAAHLSKFKQLPSRHALRVIQEVENQNLYPAVKAALVRACTGRIGPNQIRRARFRFKRIWKPRQSEYELIDALWSWLSTENHFTQAQLRYQLLYTHEPWLQMRFHLNAPWDHVLPAATATWLNTTLRSSYADVAITSAWLCAQHQVAVERPIRLINPLAKLILKEMGLVRRADVSVCGIRLAIQEMTKTNLAVNWRAFFGLSYKRAEAQLVTCKGFFKTNPSSWVNALDVFDDLLLYALYQADPNLGIYNLGNIGGVLSSPRLRNSYPAVAELANQVHAKRLESDLSHAIVRTTRRFTGPIKFGWLRVGGRLLRRAADELLAKGF